MAVLFRVCRPYKVIVGLCLLTCRFYSWIVWHGPTDKTTRVADYHDGLILSYTQELTCTSNRLARVVCGIRAAALIWHQQGQKNLSQGTRESLLRFILVVCGLRPTAFTERSWLNDSLNHSARSGPTCLEPIPQSVWATVFIVPKQAGNLRGQARWTSLRTLARAEDGHKVIKDVLAHVTNHHEHADRKQSLNDSRTTALSGLVGKELLEAPARRPFAHCRMNSGFQGVRMAPNRGGRQEATKGSVVATPFAPQLQVLHSVRSCALSMVGNSMLGRRRLQTALQRFNRAKAEGLWMPHPDW